MRWWDEVEEATQLQQKLSLKEKNQMALAKEGRLKRYRNRTKQYRQNRTFQNNPRKFCQQVGGGSAKTIQEPDARELNWFGGKIWERRDHNKKAVWMNNMEKELQNVEESRKTNIHFDSLKATLKKHQTEKIRALILI